jgi:ketosteroid isomerase-like protein
VLGFHALRAKRNDHISSQRSRQVTLSPTLIVASFGLLALAQHTVGAQAPTSPEQQIVALEKQWASAIQTQNVAATSAFLADDFFLGIGVAGGPLRIVPRAAWLDGLKEYITKSYAIDDIKVHVHSNVAVVFMLFTQQATVRGQDRSAQFAITDIWVNDSSGWRVAERHSSRPEPALASKP